MDDGKEICNFSVMEDGYFSAATGSIHRAYSFKKAFFTWLYLVN